MPSSPIHPIASTETINNQSNLTEEKYFSTKSPYYKGLTDFSLVINKERLLVPTSPVRESEGSDNRQGSDDQSNDYSGVSWHKKIGNIIYKRRNSLDLGTDDEQFEASENKSLVSQHDRRYSSSPYYKGLTDFTLDINKARLSVNKQVHENDPSQPYDPTVNNSPPLQHSGSDPDIMDTCLVSSILSDPPRSATSSDESCHDKSIKKLTRKNTMESVLENVDTNTKNLEEKILPPSSPDRDSSTSSSSKSSFVLKVQEWSSSCFTPKKSHIENVGPNFYTTNKTKTATRELLKPKKDEMDDFSESTDSEISHNGKPLRERISHPAKKPPRSPPQFPAKSVLLHTKEVNETDNDQKFFWADKYRPDALQDFICNQTKAIELQNMQGKTESCSHFIFEGLPGVGKRTMILALLREAFGTEKVEAKEQYIQFNLKGEAVRSIEVNVKESEVHIEVNLSELKGYEKHVIVELIKDTNKTLIRKCTNFTTYQDCRAIILYEADKLSSDSLLYIRWLLERYKEFNKVFFFCCNDVSKLQPIRSLCTLVQLHPPSNEEIVKVLKFIAKEEDVNLPDCVADKIANNSKNNLRQAIRSFEATSQSNPSLTENGEILTGWEDDIAKIAKSIVEEQSPKQLYNIRGKLQKLIEHNVSPEFISQSLRNELKKHLDEKVHVHVDTTFDEYYREADSGRSYPYSRHRTEETSKFEHDPVKKNVKHFMKIEELIAKFMSRYKSCEHNKGKNVIGF